MAESPEDTACPAPRSIGRPRSSSSCTSSLPMELASLSGIARRRPRSPPPRIRPRDLRRIVGSSKVELIRLGGSVPAARLEDRGAQQEHHQAHAQERGQPLRQAPALPESQPLGHGQLQALPALVQARIVAIASCMCFAESTRTIPPPVMASLRLDANDTGSPLVFLGWSRS